MSFLPEEDQEFLDENGIKYQEFLENMPNGQERRGVLFSSFTFSGNLRTTNGGSLVKAEACDLLVVIPDGYATTKLDSFYTIPKLKCADGRDPQNATVDSALFGKTWQFWSRHLDDNDWRVGIDGLRTFLSYIRGELRNA
jgi:hypothetical protein